MIENLNKQLDEEKRSQENETQKKSEKKNKISGLFKFIKNLLKAKSVNNNTIIDDGAESNLKELKIENKQHLSNELEITDVEEKTKNGEEKETNKYDDIIKFAKEIKKDKENYKILQNKYNDELKANNKEETTNIKNMIWESQNKITLSESLLRNKLKEIRKSTLSIEKKTKLINYICGVAKIKAKEKPEHLKRENETEEVIKNPVDELNERKEKIISSKHFTDVQKKNMIREIDDELIELAKKEENKTK